MFGNGLGKESLCYKPSQINELILTQGVRLRRNSENIFDAPGSGLGIGTNSAFVITLVLFSGNVRIPELLLQSECL